MTTSNDRRLDLLVFAARDALEALTGGIVNEPAERTSVVGRLQDHIPTFEEGLTLLQNYVDLVYRMGAMEAAILQEGRS